MGRMKVSAKVAQNAVYSLRAADPAVRNGLPRLARRVGEK
jgi:hypothetical protein